MIGKFLGDEDGVTAVEYGVMIAFFILAVIVAINSLAQSLADHFNDVGTRVDGM
ncbi:MAG: Flp family type IVb pilin [Planctomycetaceae bacterium]|nr:Flp family type IVb pilin [Planctomycetaceae bacterium]